MTLNGLMRSGVTRFAYTYDFGDNWEHAIVIESERPPVEGRPIPPASPEGATVRRRIVAAAGATSELLAVLADPAHPRRHEWLEMLGDDFDPEAFTVEAADARVAARFGRG